MRNSLQIIVNFRKLKIENIGYEKLTTNYSEFSKLIDTKYHVREIHYKL